MPFVQLDLYNKADYFSDVIGQSGSEAQHGFVYVGLHCIQPNLGPYWRMPMNGQDDTAERFWSMLEIQQIITLPQASCTLKAQGEQALDRQCFGFVLTNMPAQGESKIWDMLKGLTFRSKKAYADGRRKSWGS
jgi:hypothetical protein